MEHAELLPLSGVFEGKSGIAAAFMYLRRVNGYVRPKRTKSVPVGFSIETYHGTEQANKSNPDVIFWQAGPKAGKRARPEELGSGMAYGVIFQDKDKLARISEDISPIIGTNGMPYINSGLIINQLNPL